MNCVICNKEIFSLDKLIVKEMMFDSNEEFDYYQCKNCEALQIATVPTDISKYYLNNNYYTQKKEYIQLGIFKKFFWAIRSILALTKLYPFVELLRYNSILHWIYISDININSKVLDVGCGSGDVLFEFSKHGFKNLCGIDPNLTNIKSLNIKLEKSDLLSYDTELKFDLIMFNHSFEHIYEQDDTLKKALELLSGNGTILIRTPVINKAYEIYKENWVQIDAPRHFIIHSLKSIKLICEKNGAFIYNYFFDSTAFQFLGSEQFKNNITSYASNSYKTDLAQSIFSKDEINVYEEKARRFNKEGLGDQAAFFIRKKK